MIDLHVHLDGSIRPQTLVELAREQDAHLPTYDINRIKDYLVVSADCNNIDDYLKRFDLSLAVLQSRKPIRRVVSELVRDLDHQGVIYAEIRLMPQSHILRGMTQKQVVEAALEGLKQGMEYSRHIKANLVLCTMRGADEKDNFATIVEAANHMGRGVVGVDMLGDEYTYRNDMYAGQFQLLREEHIPFTVHAGVMVGAESIRQVVEYGAKRIGHGIRATEDESLMQLLKEQGIILEMCPSSNVQSRSVQNIESHPIKKFFDMGIKVTVGTDDMTICDTNFKKEYALIKEHLGFTDEDIYQMNQYAIEGAFISGYEKRRLSQRLKESFFDENAN